MIDDEHNNKKKHGSQTNGITYQKEPVMGVTRRRQIATRTGRISIPSAPGSALEVQRSYVSLPLLARSVALRTRISSMRGDREIATAVELATSQPLAAPTSAKSSRSYVSSDPSTLGGRILARAADALVPSTTA